MSWIRRHIIRFWLAYVTLVTGLLASLYFSHSTAEQTRTRQRDDFNQAVTHFRHTMELNFSCYYNILNSLAAFYSRTNLPGNQEFHDFITVQDLTSKDANLGLLDMGYYVRFNALERQQFLNVLISNNVPKANQERFAKTTDSDWVLIHWDNLRTNSLIASGSHVVTDPRRLEAMHNAAVSNAVACTEKMEVNLGDDRSIGNGFMLFAPVFRSLQIPKQIEERQKAVKGFVFASFDAKDFWSRIYNSTAEPLIRLEIYDGAEALPGKLWFDSLDSSKPPQIPVNFIPRQQLTQHLGASRRTWTFRYSSLPQFENPAQMRISYLILIGGSLASFGFYYTIRRQLCAYWHNLTLLQELDIANRATANERQKLAEQQIKSSKLESIGLLAGGIAHDFNNLLTAILGNISLARVELNQSSPCDAMLNDAETACEHAKRLTLQLLAFAKGGAPIRKTTQLGDVIIEAARLSIQGSACQCKFDIAADLWAAETDKAQIGQAIQNIVKNAAEAMPQGGLIEIKAGNCEMPLQNQQALKPGRYLKISIKDKGVGIPPDQVDKIFDPYYSTKGHGSGLGLATTYFIIKRHEGAIAVESSTGVGTKFDLYLPATEAPVRQQKIELAESAPTGRMRILLMDDDAAVINASSKMLKRLGHDVIQANEGAAAVNIYKDHLARNVKIDAVILDLIIAGGMGGAETMRELLKIDPHVKAIVSSGYSNDPVMSECQKYGFKTAVPKPYTMAALAGALTRLG